ncbi:MAG: sulfite exporter TauE/SafE family protein [Actinobacteria bacterium]|nr:sulfite exporter TauE/SafE family protein [Actinomycetota bacterium]MCZ6566841.1 sulfite exporter TauE/SafE family protein [Actinomycetota bacterium]
MIPILTGLAAGILHVFSGVDHLAALAPIAVQDPSQAGRIGGFWGLGHGIGVTVVGGVGLLLRSLADINAWSMWAEFIVGFLLIGVGFWAIYRAGRVEIHDHPHVHDAISHRHLHPHEPDDRTHHHAALGVGIFHGMAGSGYLFGVLPALALPTTQAVIYLVAFLLASVVGMSMFAFGLGVMVRRSGSEWVTRLMYGSGVLAVVVGVFWVINSWPS